MKKLTREALVKFLETNTFEEQDIGFQVMTAKAGAKYSEHVNPENHIWYVSFDGGNMYDQMQGWNDAQAKSDHSFTEKLDDFLKQYGMSYEQPYSWNMVIFKD